MKRVTNEDASRMQEMAAEAFGDLVPVGEPPTPEQIEHVQAVARILLRARKDVLAGAVAASLVASYGKGAPVLARRLIEAFGPEDEDD